MNAFINLVSKLIILVLSIAPGPVSFSEESATTNTNDIEKIEQVIILTVMPTTTFH